MESPGTILDRHADGDRIYKTIAPTLRSQANSGGSFRVQSPDGTIRPLTANEFERLMGWEVDSTAKGIAANGKEINISRTRRQQVLANGIIPAEITNICQNLATFLQ